MTTTEDTTTATEVKPQHSEATWRHMLSRYPDSMAAWLLRVGRGQCEAMRSALDVGQPLWQSAPRGPRPEGSVERYVQHQWHAWAWGLRDDGLTWTEVQVAMGYGAIEPARKARLRHMSRWPGLDADPDEIACIACYDDVPASVGAGMLPAELPEE